MPFFFNYHDPDFAQRAIDELWKPFITTYIADYGFQGVRLDAVKKIAEFPEVLRQICEHIIATCQTVHGRHPIILAELLDKNPLQYVDRLRGFGFSHILNSTYSSLYSKRARQGEGKARGQWNGGHTRNWLLHEIGTLQSIFYDPSIERTGVGGTIGYVGNHDKAALSNTVDALIREKASTSADSGETAREFIFGIACVSDAGWYMLSGDEYMLDSKPLSRNITFSSDVEPFRWGEMANDTRLCGFMGALNYTLSQLTATAYPYWVELSTVENHHHNIGIALRHVGAQHELLCVRLSNADCPLETLREGVRQYIEHYRASRTQEVPLTIGAIYIVNDTIVTTLDSDYNARMEWRWGERVGSDTPLFGQREALGLAPHP